MPQHDDESVNTALVLNRRLHDALRQRAEKEDRSMSYIARAALERFFGFDKATIDPRESEQEKVA